MLLNQPRSKAFSLCSLCLHAYIYSVYRRVTGRLDGANGLIRSNIGQKGS